MHFQRYELRIHYYVVEYILLFYKSVKSLTCDYINNPYIIVKHCEYQRL